MRRGAEGRIKGASAAQRSAGIDGTCCRLDGTLGTHDGTRLDGTPRYYCQPSARLVMVRPVSPCTLRERKVRRATEVMRRRATPKTPTCNRQRATDAVQPTTCNRRHATDNMQQTTCNRQRATDNMQQTTCNRHRATDAMQPTPCNRRAPAARVSPSH